MPWTILAEGSFRHLDHEIYRGAYMRPPAQFYLSGDAHREPPFGWATTPGVADYFDGRLAQGALCFHVEQLQRDVSAESIPQRFQAALAQNRVFGWELPFYGDTLRELTKEIEEVVGLVSIPPERIVQLDREMFRMQGLSWQIGSPHFFSQFARASNMHRMELVPPVDSLTQQPPWGINVHVAIEVTRNECRPWLTESYADLYRKFLLDYINKIVEWRCRVNDLIGNSISQTIGRHPNATHLITIGERHIRENPVQAFIRIGNSIGLVDGAHGRDRGTCP